MNLTKEAEQQNGSGFVFGKLEARHLPRKKTMIGIDMWTTPNVGTNLEGKRIGGVAFACLHRFGHPSVLSITK